MDRTKCGLIVGVFCLFMAGSAPAAYADIASGTYTLDIWNNNASSGSVLVIYNSAAHTLAVTFGPGTDPRASMDKFFWNGSANLTYVSGTSGTGIPQTVGWSQKSQTGFQVTNFGQFDKQTTTNSNGSPAYFTTIFSVSGTFDDACFAAHVNRPDSKTNAFVTDDVTSCAPVQTPELISLLLLGPGLVLLGLARKRMLS